MSEPTVADRALMLAKTLASTVAWVVGIAVTSVRSKIGSRQGGR